MKKVLQFLKDNWLAPLAMCLSILLSLSSKEDIKFYSINHLSEDSLKTIHQIISLPDEILDGAIEKKKKQELEIWEKFDYGFTPTELANLHTATNSEKSNYQRERMYIQRFAPVAVAEMQKFGIPASITLAQGIIESDRGYCSLSNPDRLNANNHFGQKGSGAKVWTKEYRRHKGGKRSEQASFRKFGNAWESYRAHSLLLYNSKHYTRLMELPVLDAAGNSNYDAWCMLLATPTNSKGHTKQYCAYMRKGITCQHPTTVRTPWGYDDVNPYGCGYATSRDYPKTLSDMIRKWGLQELDKLYNPQ